MNRKRFAALLLTLCMLFCMLPTAVFAASPYTSQADEVDSSNDVLGTTVKEVTEATFDKKLADFIKNVYPNGSTFNDEDGYGYQCFAFANCISKKIFGSYPTQYQAANGTINSNWKISRGSKALDNVTKGDIIRVNLHDDVDHSMFVTLVTAKTIYFSDANWNHANGVRHYASMSRSELEGYLDRKLKLGSNLNGEIGYIAHYKGFVPEIDTVKPSAPTGLKGAWVATDDGSSKAKISWKAVENADYYQVQYKRDGIDWTTDGDYKVPVNLSYTSKSLSKSTYSFRVRAVNDAGASGWSETLTINKKVKITFDPNGGSVTPGSMTATYKDGVLAKYNNLPTPTRDGYSFVGWFTSLTGTTKVENGTKITATKNCSIYAHWEKVQTGWLFDGGKWYYINSDGAMHTGWLFDGGKWYYLNGSGVMQTGWLATGGKWYYLNSSGAMQTGWLQLGGKWYYLNSSGVMQTGWLATGGKWYYLNGSGVMQTGWLATGGKWYYLNSSGVMQTGWLQLGGKWYYLNTSGAMVTGWQTINGKTYRFNSSGVWIP